MNAGPMTSTPTPPPSRWPLTPRTALAVYAAYLALVLGTWWVLDIPYERVGEAPFLLRAVVLPLGVAALLLALLQARGGWWPATVREAQPLRRPLMLGLLLAANLGFILPGLLTLSWSRLEPGHVALLVLGTALVGYCEETVTRGVLLTALRNSGHGERWAWFGSCALFGLMHLPNALFGTGALALVQVLLAFCMGSGLYLLRRFSGTLWLPIAVHATWDLTTLAAGQAGSALHPAQLPGMAASYVLSLLLAGLVLRKEGRAAG